MIGDGEVELLPKDNKQISDLSEQDGCVVPYGRSIEKPKRGNKTLVLDQQQLMRLSKKFGGRLEVPPSV